MGQCRFVSEESVGQSPSSVKLQLCEVETTLLSDEEAAIQILCDHTILCDQYMIASALHTAVAQASLRRECTHCSWPLLFELTC